MQQYINQKFSGWSDQDSGRTFADREFIRCSFDNCAFSVTSDPSLRSTARRMRFIDCFATAMFVFAGLIEDVEVENLQLGASDSFLLQIWGAAFKHLTLRGNLGKLMFSPLVGGDTTRAEQLSFDRANAAYYRAVDWALDIRDAEFLDCDLRSVPARLVRRDPETQVVVTRARAFEQSWRKLRFGPNIHWGISIELMLESGADDVVLVAPKRSCHFQEQLRGLQLLRKAGIAEPD